MPISDVIDIFFGFPQKGPICHALAWRVGPFAQDTLDVLLESYGSNLGV